jgi:hypothetical protein
MFSVLLDCYEWAFISDFTVISLNKASVSGTFGNVTGNVCIKIIGYFLLYVYYFSETYKGHWQ